jgi:hypothetical protein
LPFDAVVFATGYELVGGHAKWLDATLSERLGTGLAPIFDGRIGARAEPSTVEPRLRFLWGNLGMIAARPPPWPTRSGKSSTLVYARDLPRAHKTLCVLLLWPPNVQTA